MRQYILLSSLLFVPACAAEAPAAAPKCPPEASAAATTASAAAPSSYAAPALDPALAVFVSSEIQGAPRFRLSYALEGDSSVNGKFEMQPPGGSEFKPYLEWSAKKN